MSIYTGGFLEAPSCSVSVCFYTRISHTSKNKFASRSAMTFAPINISVPIPWLSKNIVTGEL